ncbi:MAG TPA: DUF4185 domain-containing protein [Labilithrix sp.]|jgi:hypothetical protein|nr:DUF4185 domain-containing protein [Labilithrix sp.]
MRASRLLHFGTCAWIAALYLAGCAPTTSNDSATALTDAGTTRDGSVNTARPPDAGDRPAVDAGSEPRFQLPADGSLPLLRKVHTEHLGQLTTTVHNPSEKVGIIGTDLGSTFERDGKLVFVFGDSWTPGAKRQDQDSLAWTTSTTIPTVGSLPKLTWITDDAGQFVAPRLPNVNLQGMNVPMEGVPVGPKTYVFFTAGFDGSSNTYSNSVLGEMDGLDVAGMKVAHNVASKKFINVSAVVEGTSAFIYGSGDYRASPVYLAKVDVSKLADRSAWTYLQSGTGTSAVFGSGEDSAQPIVPTPCVGELSVRKWATIGLYFMTYNCGKPNGIQLRWARAPEGPWSDAIVIFDHGKTVDGGHEHFIHARESEAGHDDGLSEPNRYEEWGGEYGPYLIPRYFSEEPGAVLSLVYTLSSWNPYQAHLMKTRIAIASNPIVPEVRGINLPKAAIVNADFANGLTGWSTSGDPFVVFDGPGGKKHVTTYGSEKGDATVGKLWQEFTVDATTSELRFSVHGGDARVLLMRGDEIIRSTQARRSNDQIVPVVWTLTRLRGEKVRLVIEDSLTGGWGFVSASGFELH